MSVLLHISERHTNNFQRPFYAFILVYYERTHHTYTHTLATEIFRSLPQTLTRSGEIGPLERLRLYTNVTSMFIFFYVYAIVCGCVRVFTFLSHLAPLVNFNFYHLPVVAALHECCEKMALDKVVYNLNLWIVN